MNKASLIPVVLLSATFIAQTASAEMYKWTDKSGETHYTQTPPPPDAKGKDIEDEIRLSTGKLGNTIPAASNDTPKDEMDKARKDGEKSDQKHRDFCAQQDAALKQMTANALIKWKDGDSEHFLTAEEKTAKMAEMQKNIDSMCKPEMFSKKAGEAGSKTEKATDARLSADKGDSKAITADTPASGNTTPPAAGASGASATTGNSAPPAGSMLPAAD